MQEARKDGIVAHLSVHPVNDSRRTLQTSLAIEDLDRKRDAFDREVDSASAAQDYVNEARIFLEARIADLFDGPAHPAYGAPTSAPTLFPLLDRLRGFIASRTNDLAKSPVLARLCDDHALRPGHEARRVLNESHHNKASISYADVLRIADDIRRLRTSAEAVHEEYRRFRWREPLETAPTGNVVRLTPVTAPTFDVPLCADIAAFTADGAEGGSQVTYDERLANTWFDDKALFHIRYDTLGFAVPAGSIAIVDAEGAACRDHNLVVARWSRSVFARRLLKPKNGDGVALAAETPDPRQSRPTMRFDDNAVELHRIVGVLFSHLPPPAGRQEATEIVSVPALARIEVAFRVREDSAVPLALPGQTVLAGVLLTPADLAGMRGEIVAITVADGTTYLKRVGGGIPGMPSARQFEAIGGLGSSIVIATEDVEGFADLPMMIAVRPVIGVLY